MGQKFQNTLFTAQVAEESTPSDARLDHEFFLSGALLFAVKEYVGEGVSNHLAGEVYFVSYMSFFGSTRASAAFSRLCVFMIYNNLLLILVSL
jgi:hypothetical protein